MVPILWFRYTLVIVAQDKMLPDTLTAQTTLNRELTSRVTLVIESTTKPANMVVGAYMKCPDPTYVALCSG